MTVISTIRALFGARVQSPERDQLPYRIVMIVGRPRSGTTFLQIVLDSHPQIVTSRETHLFDRYLGPMFDLYLREELDLKSGDGIGHNLKPEALNRHFRAIALSVLSSIHAKDPRASVVLEKTPNHLAHLRLIHECLPETIFIHVVRDPRGVAASMKAAGKEAWGAWAKKGPREIARLWSSQIIAAKLAAETLGGQYRQVRYEDLFVDGGSIVNELFEWLGLSRDMGLPPDLRQRFPISAMSQIEGDVTDPRVEPRERFFRRGDPQGWRDELSSAEIAAIEAECAEAMIPLGYVPDTRPTRTKSEILSADPLNIEPMAALLAMSKRLVKDGDYVHYFEADDEPFRASSGIKFAIHADKETGASFVRLSDGDAKAASHGVPQGYCLRVPDSFEASASNRRIAVSVIARAADGVQSRFALSYATNDVGNSGWRWQDAGSEWFVCTFEYDVPLMKDGQGDFIGILPDSEARPGTDLFLLVAHIL